MKHIERIVILYPGEANSYLVSNPANYSLSRLLVHLHELGEVPIVVLNRARPREQWGNIEFVHFTWRNFCSLLLRLRKQRRVLIISQTGAYHRCAALLRFVMRGSRVLVRLGGVYYKTDYLESAGFRAERRSHRRRLSVADMIISTADGTPVDLYMEKVGIEKHRYRKWLNGFPVITNQGNRARENRIVCISRLHRGKLIDCVVRSFAMALPMLKERHTLRIVGDGPERGALEALARQLGVEQQVEFVGQSYDVGQHLYSSKVLVSGLANNPVMEAIATRTPVITAEWGEMRALYGDYSNVRVVECPRLGFGPGPKPDTDAFVRCTADAIVDVLNNYPRLTEADNGETELYRWRSRVTDELELCEKLLAGLLDL